jgi:hypothetical protein
LTEFRSSSDRYIYGEMIMCEAKNGFGEGLQFRFSRLRLNTFALVATLVLCGQLALAEEPNQRVFRSPEEASAALFAAAQRTDSRALLQILGPAGKDLISSFDPAEDRKERERFVAKYKEMHRVAKDSGGEMVLYVGAENWPLPIPLVEKNGVWCFDTHAGKEEILARRVGRNELAAINACYQLVNAEERHYAMTNYGDHEYALKFISDDDREDGLFSPEIREQSGGPVDPLIASAGVENATSGVDAVAPHDSEPFNGYYFRIVKAQGGNAEGGAKSYIVNGKMVGGFAFVAYPAAYSSSGIMTFIVNQNGVVYQKDLGRDTNKIASAMAEYDPDSTWERAVD